MKRTFQPNRRRRAHPRLPGAHGDQERPAGPEAPPRQGPQAPHGFLASRNAAASLALRRESAAMHVPALHQSPATSGAAREFQQVFDAGRRVPRPLSSRCSSRPITRRHAGSASSPARKLGDAVAQEPRQTLDSRDVPAAAPAGRAAPSTSWSFRGASSSMRRSPASKRDFATLLERCAARLPAPPMPVS